jgi:hypothetical protein
VTNYNFDLHPEFPHKVLVVVEQPRNEMYRCIYDPASGTFSRSTIKSLVYIRGFSGVYGWVGGTGVPPGPHHDILLFTRQFPVCGDSLTGHICGIFLRQDNDHKFVAVDEEIRRHMAGADLSFLDNTHYNELLQLYPRVDEGEGWHGAEVAITQLLKKPLHE